MQNRGFGRKETLVLGFTFLVFLAIIVPLTCKSIGGQKTSNEVRRMRQLFLALALYEQDAYGKPAPSILSARPYSFSDAQLVSANDPFTSGSLFPNDAGLPNGKKESPVRISETYLWAHLQGAKSVPPSTTQPGVGLLANEWQGAISAKGAFDATVAGRVHRVMMDGSFQSLDRPSRNLGDVKQLFNWPQNPSK